MDSESICMEGFIELNMEVTNTISVVFIFILISCSIYTVTAFSVFIVLQMPVGTIHNCTKMINNN